MRDPRPTLRVATCASSCAGEAAPDARPSDPRSRADRILDAVARLLPESGFDGLAINAIAREAGVDKVLIYRYFGGLPGLLEAFAQRGDYWPSAEELVGDDPPADRSELAVHVLVE